MDAPNGQAICLETQLDALDDERDSLADADAHGAERVSAAAAPQLVDRRRDESRSTASPCAANASLSSITSICASARPVSSSTFRVAGAGPIPMTRGATPAVAMPTMRARGTRPCRAAARSLASSSAQAPSLTPEALPAVIVPSGLTTPLSLASASRLVSRGCSSFDTTIGSPFFCAIVTGTISPSKNPAFCAATAFCCEASAILSCASRSIL
jgi:hypothetical protein